MKLLHIGCFNKELVKRYAGYIQGNTEILSIFNYLKLCQTIKSTYMVGGYEN